MDSDHPRATAHQDLDEAGSAAEQARCHAADMQHVSNTQTSKCIKGDVHRVTDVTP